MNARGEGRPFPNPSLAFTLATTALVVSLVPTLAGGGVVGIAIGSALGFGGIGVLAARLVPEPAAERLGLAPFPLRAIAPILLLAPAVLIVSELDNWIRIAFSAPQSETLGVAAVPALEAIVFAALLNPVLEEFFFRGVLLQGCASVLGRWRALLYVAALQIALVPALVFVDAFSVKPSTAPIVSQGAGTVLFGLAYGLVRLATRSLLPSIVLSGAIASLGLAAGALADRVPIPGFNAPGATTPLVYLIPALASVALGVWLLTEQLAREPELPPIPPPAPEDDEEPGPLF
jgi:membrane protease YdiL (CAAX protease family)